MQLFFHPEIKTSSETLTFSKDESRHIVRSLRKTEGDKLSITDGKGKLYSAEIVQALDKKCTVRIDGWQEMTSHRNYHLHIAIAPTKLNDRFEWFLEKATEIGIDEITPLICAHSERRELKTERMEKVILSAMKQSLKFNLPVLNEPVNFKEFLLQNTWDLGLIAHCEDEPRNRLTSIFPCHERIMILIGPEGDFSVEEIKAALDLDIKPITLGKSRLRTETAGIVACNAVALLNENS